MLIAKSHGERLAALLLSSLKQDHRLRIAIGASWTIKPQPGRILIGGDTLVVLGHNHVFNLHIRSQVRDMLVDEVVKRRQIAEEGHDDLDLDTPKFAYVLQCDYLEDIVESQKDAQNVRDCEKNDGGPHDPPLRNKLRLPILNQLHPRANIKEAEEQNECHRGQLVDVDVVVRIILKNIVEGLGQRNEQCGEDHKKDARATVEPFNPPLHLDDLFSKFVGRLPIAVDQLVQFTQS